MTRTSRKPAMGRGKPPRRGAARLLAANRLTWMRLLAGIMLAVLTLFVLAQFYFLCKVYWYSKYPPDSTPIMRAALADLQRSQPGARLQYVWVPYDQISNNLKRAVVAAEDARFMQHQGIDWEALRDAWEHNRALDERRAQALEAGEVPPRGVLRGGSTITQQLAKNLFLSNERTYARKAQELIITWMIEHVMTKQRILELYLNVAEWGNGVFGAEAAARHYFRTSAARLDPSQAAQLAVMLPNPRFYDANGPTRYLLSRARTIAARARQAMIP